MMYPLMAPAASPAATLLDLLMDQIEQERARTSTRQQRGVTLATTSAALAALLFTLTTASLRDGHFVLDAVAKATVLIAVACSVAAAATGLVTAVFAPRSPVADVAQLSEWLKSAGSTEVTTLEASVARRLLSDLQTMRQSSLSSATDWIHAALLFELAGLLVVGIGLADVMLTH